MGMNSYVKYIGSIGVNRFSSRHFRCRIVRWTELLLVVGFGVAHAWATPLMAAVAKIDITPEPGLQMWGFSDRKGAATGTLDPLYARVLVLEASGKRLALVSVDLGRPFGTGSLDALRRATQKDVSFLVLAATHTHSAPTVMDQYPNGPPRWETTALQKIAKAVAEACKHLTDAQIGTGYGSAFISHNRLRLNPDGTVTWFERNLTRVLTAPADATVSLLRVDGKDGQPIAILVGYACHPVVFGSDNLRYSADFPAVMTRTVEDAFTGKPLCFFLQGAPGDVNPYYAVTPLEEDAVGMRDWTGRTLGEEAVRIAKEIHTRADEHPELQFVEDSVHVHQRWNPEKWREAMIAVFGSTGSSPFATKPAEIALPVTTILVNRKVAILTMPGEPFVEYQINWRGRCPVPDAFVIGYANGYEGYFPTMRSATLGGYGAANPATWVEVGAGERMVDVGVIRVNQMLGHLHELPEDFK
jgi:neutral ceramidase